MGLRGGVPTAGNWVRQKEELICRSPGKDKEVLRAWRAPWRNFVDPKLSFSSRVTHFSLLTILSKHLAHRGTPFHCDSPPKSGSITDPRPTHGLDARVLECGGGG